MATPLMKPFSELFPPIFVAGLLTAGSAAASSCCTGGGGQSLCVLPSEQNYQLGMSAGYREIHGYFDAYGDYLENSASTRLQTVESVIGAAFRLDEYWQAGLSVPFVHSRKRLADVGHVGTSMGDPALEARYTLWEDLAFLRYRPQLSFYAGARIPLGSSAYTSPDVSEASAAGDGAWVPYVGLNTSKTIGSVKFGFDAAYFRPLSHTVTKFHGLAVANPYDFESGNRVQLAQAATYLLNEHWSAGLGLRQLWASESRRNGVILDGSASRLFAMTFSANYFHDANWSFGASFDSAFPFYAYAANQPYAQSVTFSTSYGGF